MTDRTADKEVPLATGRVAVLVGGAPVEHADLDWALARADLAVAADGGAAALLGAGRCPDAVIGDMDSLAPDTAARIPATRLHLVEEQETTDFEKCLRRIASPTILGVGFLGGRTDHTLAVLSCLARLQPPCLLVGTDTVAFAPPTEIRLDLPIGTRLSLFPFATVTGRSDGLRWPINGIDFAPSGPIGTSNETTGQVRLAFDGPGMVVLLPPETRDAALFAISSSER